MHATVTIDKAGRIVIPKPVRDKLRLGAGDILALEAEDDQFVLKPIHPGTRLTKERENVARRQGAAYRGPALE